MTTLKQLSNMKKFCFSRGQPSETSKLRRGKAAGLLLEDGEPPKKLWGALISKTDWLKSHSQNSTMTNEFTTQKNQEKGDLVQVLQY